MYTTHCACSCFPFPIQNWESVLLLGVIRLPIPFHLVLLSPEALIVVALGLEELLEVGLAVDNTLQRSIRASSGGEGVRVRGDGMME